jgi:hypothetical protein
MSKEQDRRKFQELINKVYTKMRKNMDKFKMRIDFWLLDHVV